MHAHIQAPAPPQHWRNHFADLGLQFYTPLDPQGLPAPYWVASSQPCAQLLGLPENWQAIPQSLDVFSGNGSWPGMQTLASVYSGHQFGVWAGQLGDGRALYLGELAGQELQLKGAGMTPYSRMGDGRAVLRSSIREFIASEAMHALGVPTTRALCLTGSALPVRRETIETAAVLTRVAPSFIRFGHFEHFSYREQPENLRKLADFVIEHYATECGNAQQPYAGLLAWVAQQTATLMAHWQSLGFCHGVMNTDNMSVLGLTLDYGPFGWLDAFDPGHICNHSDSKGRYSWARQPQMAFWNLHALAQACMPLMGNDSDAAIQAIGGYRDRFEVQMQSRWRAKLGLEQAQAGDADLIDDWLRLMAANQADFSLAFRRLNLVKRASASTAPQLKALFHDQAALEVWLERYRARLSAQPLSDTARHDFLNAHNPATLPRNYLLETAIQQAQAGDFSEVQRLLAVLQDPYREPDIAQDAALPPDWARGIELSCSS